MKTERNEQIERTERFLDERWYIANMLDARPQDVSYYNGALKALEMAGYEWKREDGEHTVRRAVTEKYQSLLQIKTEEVMITKINYVANDGKEFNTAAECLEYEK